MGYLAPAATVGIFVLLGSMIVIAFCGGPVSTASFRFWPYNGLSGASKWFGCVVFSLGGKVFCECENMWINTLLDALWTHSLCSMSLPIHLRLCTHTSVDGLYHSPITTRQHGNMTTRLVQNLLILSLLHSRTIDIQFPRRNGTATKACPRRVDRSVFRHGGVHYHRSWFVGSIPLRHRRHHIQPTLNILAPGLYRL